MKFSQTKPCSQCPFRKKSLPGWLGAATPEEFIGATMEDGLMPCHKTVNYDKPDWKWAMLAPQSKVQHCAGARIFFRNQCKVSRNDYYVEAKRLGMITEVEPSDDVFKNKHEFLAHHTKFKKALAKRAKALAVPDAPGPNEAEGTYTCGECGTVYPLDLQGGCPQCGT